MRTVSDEIGRVAQNLQISLAEKKLIQMTLDEIDNKGFDLASLTGNEEECKRLWKMRDRALWKLKRMDSMIKNINKQMADKSKQNGGQYIFDYAIPTVDEYLEMIREEIADENG